MREFNVFASEGLTPAGGPKPPAKKTRNRDAVYYRPQDVSAEGVVKRGARSFTRDQAIKAGIIPANLPDPNEAQEVPEISLPKHVKPDPETIAKSEEMVGRELTGNVPAIITPEAPAEIVVPKTTSAPAPLGNDLPQMMLEGLIGAIKTEKESGVNIQLLDQNGNPVTGLSILRPVKGNTLTF